MEVKIMQSTEFSFLNRPIVNVPFITSPLLKMHGRIVTIFEPFNSDESRLWQTVKRIAALFSSLFVYPGLGILMFVSAISAKLKGKVGKNASDDDLVLISGSKKDPFDPSLTIPQREALLKEKITELKESNRILGDRIKNLESDLKNDPELFAIFTACHNQTKDILLKPPKRDDSPPNPNPLLEEWRQAKQEQSYLNAKKTRILDFLEKNPVFCEAVKVKLGKTSQGESSGIPLLF